jgi:hypothetical protein
MPMKFAIMVLGIVLLALAIAYFVVPAGSLPEFIPGYEAGSDRIHVKHGLVSLAAAVVLLGVAWVTGRSSR